MTIEMKTASGDRTDGGKAGAAGARAGWLQSLARGLRRRCPRCGEGRLFVRYLSLRPSCSGCGLAFDPIRADDAPAYFTIFIVGHIVVSLYLAVETAFRPSPPMQAAIWLPATLVLCLALLPPIKGAVMAVIFKTRAGSEFHR